MDLELLGEEKGRPESLEEDVREPWTDCLLRVLQQSAPYNELGGREVSEVPLKSIF